MADKRFWDKRVIGIKTLVTEQEMAELKAAAERASVRLAAYVRMAALKETRRETAKEAARAA
jgi:hypothetical protein